jgi:hypothetical protein
MIGDSPQESRIAISCATATAVTRSRPDAPVASAMASTAGTTLGVAWPPRLNSAL